MKKNNIFINKIIYGDCLEVLKPMKNNFVDLVITSPPYDNLRNYKGYNFEFEKIADILFKKLKPGGVIVWIVGDETIKGSESGTSFKHALYFKSIGLNLHDTMIFKKVNPIPQIYRKRYNNEYEYMFVCSKGKISTHNPIMVDCLHAGLNLSSTKYKNYSKNDQKRSKFAKPVKKQKVKGNIWEYVVGKKKIDQGSKNHSAPFPFQLTYDHIISWTNKGDIVLDPMCGSGTACLAAQILGRKYIGIDISKDYCKISKRRIKNSKNNVQSN